MNDTLPLVRKLQADAIDADTSVSSLLRLAKIVATKLELADALSWIDRELNGYMDIKVEDLPAYRRLSGEPKAWNPYHGWQSIHFTEAENARLFAQAPIGQALVAIEDDLRNRKGGHFSFPYPPEIKAHLAKAIDYTTDMHVELGFSQLWNIVEQVRNLILNWSLELEKAGVVGGEMAFTAKEKKTAGPVSQQFFIQNVGVLGNVSDQAQVSNEQTSAVNVSLDIAQIRDFAVQTRKSLSLLTVEAQQELEPFLDHVESELATDEPDQSKLRKWLNSIRTICEGAAGNLTATGMLNLLRGLLGS